MKKLLKVNLLAIAMIFAIGTAFAFKAGSTNSVNEKWANDNGTWHYVEGQTQQPSPGQPGDYRCDLVEEPPICTAEFPQGNDPNVDQSGMTNITNGLYSEL